MKTSARITFPSPIDIEMFNHWDTKAFKGWNPPNCQMDCNYGILPEEFKDSVSYFEASEFRKKKILLIDDDQGNIDVITLVLSEFDYEVISSLSSDILDEVLQIMPDVILLDHWLNGISGSELCKGLKADLDTASIPLILISAVSGLDSIALACGADNYISKPFDIDDLSSVVSSLICF